MQMEFRLKQWGKVNSISKSNINEFRIYKRKCSCNSLIPDIAEGTEILSQTVFPLESKKRTYTYILT